MALLGGALLVAGSITMLFGRTYLPSAASSTRIEPIVGTLVGALMDGANRRREGRSQTDTEYAHRVDSALSENRINFLLYGYGESHEPPTLEKGIIGSVTVVSLDAKALTVSLVSLTHDIRAPEVERYLRTKGDYDEKAVRIDQAYPVGGFELMRETIEDATGLAIDYQMAFHDRLIVSFVDELFAAVNVDVPRDFVANPFYLDGVKYGARRFERGRMAMDGATVLQYIKSVPAIEEQGYYGQDLEHNARKHLVLEGMLTTLQARKVDLVFALRLAQLLVAQEAEGQLASDIDIGRLLFAHFDALPELGGALLQEREGMSRLPTIEETVYIVDSAHGTGGVQWVTANESPLTKAELALGRYPHPAFEVPLDANPYGDLVTEYWPSVRVIVHEALAKSR